MANQKGAALIVVLSLLVGSLVIGLTSMQSSQVDERLAGNQKLASEVQMAAETAVAEGLSRISEPDGIPGLLQYLLRGECSIESLFLPGDREDLSWSNVDTKIPGWSTLLNDGKPCEDYDGSWIVDRNNAVDGDDYPDPVFTDADGLGLYDNLGKNTCAGSMQCIYRYMSYGGNRYIVGLAAYFNDDGDLIAESRPVYVDLDVDDPPSDLDWIFSAPPLSFLTYINDLKISGANNMTLLGGDIDIMAHGDNIVDLHDQLANKNNEDPSACYLPGTTDPNDPNDLDDSSDPNKYDSCTYGGGDFSSPDNFIAVLQTLVEVSAQSDRIEYYQGDLQMKDHPFDSDGADDAGKILIVGGDFKWNGANPFKGTVIVLGPTFDYAGGGGAEFLGSVIHAPLKHKDPNYEWLDEDEYVDFSNVDDFEVGDWRFLEEGDSVVTNFDFSGGGNSTIRNDAEAQMEAADELWGAFSSAEFLTWESE